MQLNEMLDNILNEQRYIVIDLSGMDEGAGNLKGLTPHLMKVVTQGSGGRGGEHSAVTSSGRLKSAAELSKHLGNAMRAGHTAVVYKNGHPIAAVHPKYLGDREPFEVHTGDQKHIEKEHVPAEWQGSRRTGYLKKAYERDKSLFSHRPAVDHVVHDIVHKDQTDDAAYKQAYKDHNIEVKAYAPDVQRAKLADKRLGNRPTFQYNYEKGMSKTKYKDRSDSKLMSKTPAGDMSKFKRAGAIKLAKKVLGDSGSPYSTAKQLHAELDKHIESGDHRAARDVADKLRHSIERYGLGKENPDVERYASSFDRYHVYGKKEREDLRSRNNR